MPFAVIHPREFSRFGLVKTPSRTTLKRWRESQSFPEPLEIPRGYYRLDEVEAWFATRSPRSREAANAAASVAVGAQS